VERVVVVVDFARSPTQKSLDRISFLAPILPASGVQLHSRGPLQFAHPWSCAQNTALVFVTLWNAFQFQDNSDIGWQEIRFHHEFRRFSPDIFCIPLSPPHLPGNRKCSQWLPVPSSVHMEGLFLCFLFPKDLFFPTPPDTILHDV